MIANICYVNSKDDIGNVGMGTIVVVAGVNEKAVGVKTGNGMMWLDVLTSEDPTTIEKAVEPSPTAS